MFFAGLGAAVVALPRAALPQAQSLPKVGIVGSIGPGAVESLKEGLRAAGLVEGKTIVILGGPASAAGRDAVTRMVADYVAKPVDVIFASGSLATEIAKAATTAIAIVSVSGDPVGAKFVESLAHPGGNVTGLSIAASDAVGKRLEIFTRIAPDLERIAILFNPDDTSSELLQQAAIAAAVKLNLHLTMLAVHSESEFSEAFAAASLAKAQAMSLMPNPVLDVAGRRIAELELLHKLPVIGFNETFPKFGGLMSYGPIVRELYKRGGYYISRILAGAKPSELPIEQPTKFNLVINLKTAQALDVKMPDTLLASADEAIE